MASELQQKFKKAVDFIQNLPTEGEFQASNQQKLEFYALYKQAVDGPNKSKKPGMLNVVAKMKWEAWNQLGKMSKDDAMRTYIKKVIDVSKKIPGAQSDALRTALTAAPASKL
eukprot:TRINITY_DN3141_c0_g1_i1.p1 TRINITY_DN3141_c0_g1~~TRINITY_DN3141_c0_g1_i1.p1  ORF type:complete len:113 (+),score=27.76 TRINITY_DN3141_c0_g1_i1:71-409(+)